MLAVLSEDGRNQRKFRGTALYSEGCLYQPSRGRKKKFRGRAVPRNLIMMQTGIQTKSPQGPDASVIFKARKPHSTDDVNGLDVDQFESISISIHFTSIYQVLCGPPR